MEELSTHLQKQIEKVEELNNFANIICNKDVYKQDLFALQTKHNDVRYVLDQCKAMVRTFQDITSEKCRALLKDSQQQTLIMFNMLEHIDHLQELPPQSSAKHFGNSLSWSTHKENNQNNNNGDHFLLDGNVTPLIYRGGHSFGSTTGDRGTTGGGQSNNRPSMRINLSEYEKSPFTKQMKPIALQFYDFDAIIKLKDFNEIPRYLRGRDTLDDIQSTLEIISQCFNEKYTLLHKNREAVKNPKLLGLWKLFHTEESYFPGKKFISIGDIARTLSKSVDRKFTNRLTILRDMKVLKEYRKHSTTFYVWNL